MSDTDSAQPPPRKGLSKFVESRGFKATIKVETGGRKGKTVTVIGGLPKNELFLQEMTKQLKSKCGAGGTYDSSGRDGVVEIQGDQRERIRTYLTSEDIKFTG
jgi:translation initiation factor 1